MYPSLVADYLGISTGTISSSTTGAFSIYPSYNCLYLLLETSNAKTTSVSDIYGPVRWQIDVPTTNNTQWDWWGNDADNYKRANESGRLTTDIKTKNLVGLTSTLLPGSGDSHLVSPATMATTPSPVTGFVNSWIHEFSVTGSAFDAPDIDAIVSPTLVWAKGTALAGFYYYEHTARDYVNGVLYDGTNPAVAGDTWYRDVWYRVQFTHNAAYPAEPRVFGLHWNVSVESNSSRRTNQSRLMRFHDYNVSADFDPASHTYAITAIGDHTWTFPGGVRGPIKMATGGGWTRSLNSPSSSVPAAMRWAANSPFFWPAVTAVELIYGQEVPIVVLEFGSTYATANNLATKIPYTPETDGNYLASTYATDAAATITHCDLGAFDQAGTTVFKRVPWDAAASINDGGFSTYSYRRGHDGGGTIPDAIQAPDMLVLKRTGLSALTITTDTYNSGSGNWISPIAGQVLMRSWGGGGGGGAGGGGSGSNGGSGGGGGGYCEKLLTVTLSQSIAYSIGSGGAGGIDGVTDVGSAGGTTTVAGGTYTANGGSGGDYGDNDPTVSAAGGTASGGDTNADGAASAAVTSGDDGSAGGAASAGGGAGGAGGVESTSSAGSGASPGGGGGGGAKSAEPGGAGAAGRVTFTYLA